MVVVSGSGCNRDCASMSSHCVVLFGATLTRNRSKVMKLEARAGSWKKRIVCDLFSIGKSLVSFCIKIHQRDIWQLAYLYQRTEVVRRNREQEVQWWQEREKGKGEN
jgi:hypothetical protein